MSILDDLKAKADANGDGKITMADLDSLKDGTNDDLINRLKQKAARFDGKLNLNDPRHIDTNNLISDTRFTK